MAMLSGVARVSTAAVAAGARGGCDGVRVACGRTMATLSTGRSGTSLVTPMELDVELRKVTDLLE